MSEVGHTLESDCYPNYCGFFNLVYAHKTSRTLHASDDIFYEFEIYSLQWAIGLLIYIFNRLRGMKFPFLLSLLMRNRVTSALPIVAKRSFSFPFIIIILLLLRFK